MQELSPAAALTILQAGFLTLPILLILWVARAARSLHLAIGASAWLILTSLLAHLSLLSDFSATPPRAPILLGVTMALTLAIASTRHGQTIARRPASWLIGVQAFRLPVELLIHLATTQHIAPPQLTWSGLNFDIITGITALLLAPFAHRAPRALLLGWNILGCGLLLNVMVVAILSLPTPLQQLHPDNTWVTHFPYVSLPTILVPTALLAHIALFRKLLSRPHSASA